MRIVVTAVDVKLKIIIIVIVVVIMIIIIVVVVFTPSLVQWVCFKQFACTCHHRLWETALTRLPLAWPGQPGAW